MSHIVAIEVQIHDLGALKIATTRLGLAWLAGQQTYRHYYGTGACDHAIGIQGDDKAFQIGVSREDGNKHYSLKWDNYDNKIVNRIHDTVNTPANKRNATMAEGVLKQYYAAEAAKRAARRAGFTPVEQKQEDGAIRITASR